MTYCVFLMYTAHCVRYVVKCVSEDLCVLVPHSLSLPVLKLRIAAQ